MIDAQKQDFLRSQFFIVATCYHTRWSNCCFLGSSSVVENSLFINCDVILDTVWLVIFVGLIFRGLGSSDNFVGLYFRGVPTLIT